VYAISTTRSSVLPRCVSPLRSTLDFNAPSLLVHCCVFLTSHKEGKLISPKHVTIYKKPPSDFSSDGSSPYVPSSRDIFSYTIVHHVHARKRVLDLFQASTPSFKWKFKSMRSQISTKRRRSNLRPPSWLQRIHPHGIQLCG